MFTRFTKIMLAVLLMVILMMPAPMALAEDNPFSSDQDGFSVQEEMLDLLSEENTSSIEHELEEGSDFEDEEPDAFLVEEFSALTTQYAAPIPSGRYLLRPILSHTRVLEVAGASMAKGGNIQLFSSVMAQRQWFDIEVDSNTGLYTIKNVRSGMFLEVHGREAKHGANVWQFSRRNTQAQQWYIVADPNNPGAFRIVSALSTLRNGLESGPDVVPQFTTAFVLNIQGASNRDRANVQIARANGSTAQAFALIPSNAGVVPGNANIANGIYKIASNLSGRPLLEVRGANTKSGAQLQINTSKNNLSQDFMLRRESDGFYSIRPLHSGGGIGVPMGHRVAGIAIRQDAAQAIRAQRWAINQNPDGSLSFISKASGLAMTVNGSSNKVGTSIVQWYPDGRASQRFTLRTPSAKVISEGYTLIIPKTQSKKRVEIADNSLSNNANVQASNSNSAFSQRFEVKYLSDGIYTFQSVRSGHYLTASGGTVVQRKATANRLLDSQKWKIRRTFGGYNIVNVGNNQAMNLTTGGTGGHDLRLAAPSGNRSQIFTFRKTNLAPSDGIHHLNTAGGFRLHSVGGRTTNSNPTQVFTRNTSPAQKWRFVKEQGEYFSIRCVRSGQVLTIDSNSTRNGTRVLLGNNAKMRGQLWRFVHAGDGRYHLQSQSGMYMYATSDSRSGGLIMVNRNIIPRTLKFRHSKTTYTPPPPAPTYFGTYVDVNLSTQSMMYIVDGRVVFSSLVVTGKPSTPTPTGTYNILWKQSPSVLVGPGYRTPVSYWMPFTHQGHGFHDATWQPWFGGDRWIHGGSLGCVNMPLWQAGVFYDMVPSGTRVSIHW